MVKQETLEKAAEKLYPEEWNWREKNSFIEGAIWQQERMYSEEEVHKIIESYQNIMENNPIHTHYDKWFEQFKKKQDEKSSHTTN